MVRGNCLCGGVAFEIATPIDDLECCHCSECRRAYGSAFGTIAIVARADFAWTRGEDRIRRFRQSERVNRYFCERCGSPLPMVEDWDPLVGVPAGLLEGDLDARITSHIFVGSKARWWSIGGDAPRHEAYPEGEDMNERAAELRSRKADPAP